MNKPVLIILGVLLFALSISTYTIYVNWPQKTFTATTQPFRILTPEVTPGGKISWLAAICRYTDKPFESIRQLYNLDTGTKTQLLEKGTTSVLKVGECAANARSVVVPQDTPLGRYRLELTVYTRVNKYNIIAKTFVTEPFTIK